jgi:hypothetical protein
MALCDYRYQHQIGYSFKISEIMANQRYLMPHCADGDPGIRNRYRSTRFFSLSHDLAVALSDLEVVGNHHKVAQSRFYLRFSAPHP